jgi:serine/threonine protein kinase
MPMSAKLMPLTGAQDGADSSFDEIVERIGELVDMGGITEAHQLIVQHPEHAERLHKLLPALEILTSIDATPGDLVVGANNQSRQLGDFQLLREIGRGGMGVVYEADQLSLGRRVALKVLTNAALLDSSQLERFKNEARIAAGLHHSNIVLVYMVDSERGVHFYAMQLIDGQDLANVIEQALLTETPQHDVSPRPSLATAASMFPDEQALLETPRELVPNARLRTMVGWAATVADALAYTHGLGVLDRDIKPGNLLVDRTG